MKYSILELARNAFSKHRNWQPVWRDPVPKNHYDIVIIGGGGHGLATAYYLAKKHRITNVAVLEKGWIGGGNTGRNTTVVRSNYFYPESTRFFDHSLDLYEKLSLEFNYNLLLSQHGVTTLAHSRHDLEMLERWANSMQVQAVDSKMLTVPEIKHRFPLIDTSSDTRYPIWGGFVQERAGVARHDAVAWGYARGADAMGVDIIQNCAVQGMRVDQGRIRGVETSKGVITADKVAMCVAGHTSVLGAMAGIALPIVSQPLQAMVSEPVKPCLNGVVLSPAVHCYVSQSDRGEILIGGGADRYPSYAQRGTLPVTEETLAAVSTLFPAFRNLKLMRQWAGICDISPDASPIMGKTPVVGLYISAGWGTGGFKAIPAGGDCLAYTIAHDKPHELIAPFGLDRFARGMFIDEGAAAGVAH